MELGVGGFLGFNPNNRYPYGALTPTMLFSAGVWAEAAVTGSASPLSLRALVEVPIWNQLSTLSHSGSRVTMSPSIGVVIR
jgi:hypothetical protein